MLKEFSAAECIRRRYKIWIIAIATAILSTCEKDEVINGNGPPTLFGHSL
jgi:hypothetical protein